MNSYSFVSALRKSRRLFRLLIILACLSGLLIALQVLLPSLAFASSHTSRLSHARLADGFTFGTSQALDRASVSVVRLTVSYTMTLTVATRSAITVPPPPECSSPNLTGLGVLVGSWPSAPGSQDMVNWVLTDGSLINPEEIACAGTRTTLQLSGIQIYASSAYSNTSSGLILKTLQCQPSSCSDGIVQCQVSPGCDKGVALLPFHMTQPQPFLNLDATPAPTDQRTSQGLELQGSLTASPTVQQAAHFLTPTLLSPSEPSELGMPIVTASGQLFDMHTGNADTAQTIRDYVSTQLQPLQGSNTNALHDAWDKGLGEFYANNLPAAQTDLQKAGKLNSQFQAPTTFLSLSSFKTTTGSGGANPTTNSHSLDKNPISSSGEINIFGLHVPKIWLVVGGVILLVILLLLLSWVFVRRQVRRRRELAHFEKEQRAAAQRAASDAALIAEREKREQQRARPVHTRQLQYPQQPPTAIQQLSPVMNNGPMPAPMPPAPPMPLAPPVGMVPVSAMDDQPTLPIFPSGNSSIDMETTLPSFNVEQHLGRNMSLFVGTRSDPGIKRKHKPNEDSLFAAQGERANNSQTQHFGLFVVADGMGGHSNGQDASRLAIQTIVNSMLPRLSSNEPLNENALVNVLVDGVQEANAAVHQHNMELRADMGTTMTAALVVGDMAYVANVGDSRTYLYREPQGLRKVTNDHSVVASLVEAGIIKPDDIYTHPKRNQIYRSLGEKPVIDVDSFTVQLQPGDKLLLCSDGLWDMVRDPLIQQVMAQVPDPAQTGNALIKAALDGGGEDNVSVIVVSVTEATKRTGLTGIQLLAKPDTVQMPPM